jgi:hypothetical protein
VVVVHRFDYNSTFDLMSSFLIFFLEIHIYLFMDGLTDLYLSTSFLLELIFIRQVLVRCRVRFFFCLCVINQSRSSISLKIKPDKPESFQTKFHHYLHFFNEMFALFKQYFPVSIKMSGNFWKIQPTLCTWGM